MRTMYLAIHYDCNHNCVICPRGNKKHKGSITQKQIEDMFYRAKLVQGINSVILSGGEPLLHSQIFDILQYFQDQQIKVSVLTNGNRLADEGFVQKIGEHISKENIAFIVSLHSHIEDLNNLIAGYNNSYAETIKGLDNLVKYGYTVQVKHCIHKMNYTFLPDFVQWFTKKYHDYVSINVCNIDYCGLNEKKLTDCSVSLKKTGRQINKALSYFSKHNVNGKIIVSDTPLCTVKRRYWKYISKTGQLLGYTDPTNGSNNCVPAYDISKSFPQCKNCKLKNICPGTWNATIKCLGKKGIPLFNFDRLWGNNYE